MWEDSRNGSNCLQDEGEVPNAEDDPGHEVYWNISTIF